MAHGIFVLKTDSQRSLVWCIVGFTKLNKPSFDYGAFITNATLSLDG